MVTTINAEIFEDTEPASVGLGWGARRAKGHLPEKQAMESIASSMISWYGRIQQNLGTRLRPFWSIKGHHLMKLFTRL